jgi:hypothetical protein
LGIHILFKIKDRRDRGKAMAILRKRRRGKSPVSPYRPYKDADYPLYGYT